MSGNNQGIVSRLLYWKYMYSYLLLSSVSLVCSYLCSTYTCMCCSRSLVPRPYLYLIWWSCTNWLHICDLICEKGPLGANYLLELWSKISNQPKICQFLDYSSITNYYPLPTFWHKSDARACCCCCTRSVYFYPLDPPSIACNEGVVTWCQCYHGNGGSLTSVKDRFSA